MPTRFERRQLQSSQLPTAAELFSKADAKEERLCIFCDLKHLSNNCPHAIEWTLEKRKQRIIQKGACFKCLKLKHLSRYCKATVSCSLCGKGHYAIMCSSNYQNHNIIIQTNLHQWLVML